MKCLICHRKLKNEKSLAMGMGSVCAKKHGISINTQKNVKKKLHRRVYKNQLNVLELLKEIEKKEVNNMNKIAFEGFPKIPRLSREIVITEKLDGTNAFIQITDDGQFLIGSRNRFITYDVSTNKLTNSDNMGFASWALENKEELLKLGIGKHFGEWVGKGINKNDYNLTDKKFVLFNVHKWNNENKPACCEVVPVLYTGIFCTEKIEEVMNNLKVNGSAFSKGFMKPEGIVIYHTASKQLYKKTFENDQYGKENQ